MSEGWTDVCLWAFVWMSITIYFGVTWWFMARRDRARSAQERGVESPDEQPSAHGDEPEWRDILVRLRAKD